MFKKFITVILIILSIIILLKPAKAGVWEKMHGNLYETKTAAGYPVTGDNALPALIASVIKIILSFIGAIYLFMIIIAGWQWLFSGGNEEKTGAAMKRITHSTIGLIIVLAAYLLTDFITTVFIAATGVGKG
ncbi:hypothetical protein A2Y83_01845 [Candidatus Falkowbacteria bacterium RBG_13_39_14]|uniref:Uncharacterized protein n=1 Tax=Candidatus Falkowbacteria bacterium RBG_13_39_14 TaxID=1797985 RepID=A0A1F5S2Z0_9BACT|nr:MAG: hypothetical protein A2Y83_01845 [Candidatus Falkowbacteria bacterium RBG_13_39_14]